MTKQSKSLERLIRELKKIPARKLSPRLRENDNKYQFSVKVGNYTIKAVEAISTDSEGSTYTYYSFSIIYAGKKVYVESGQSPKSQAEAVYNVLGNKYQEFKRESEEEEIKGLVAKILSCQKQAES